MDSGEILSICCLAAYLVLLVTIFCGWYFYLHETNVKYYKRHRENFEEEYLDQTWPTASKTKSMAVAFDNDFPLRFEEVSFSNTIPKLE